MVKIENSNEATARIEAALYSAGRPLKIEELIRASGTESRTKTQEYLNNLMKKTKIHFQSNRNSYSSRWFICFSIKTRI